MSLKLTLWKFSKRENSTAIPSAPGTELDILLKDRTQILSPVFLLELSSYPDYNYALFEGRYYFITQIESLREDLWSLSCRVDVLGTYKASIQATTAFVLYDTSANTELTDSRISMKTSSTLQIESASFATIGGGSFAAVSIVGRSNTRTFLMSLADAGNLMSGINNWITTAIASPAGGSGSPEEAIDGFAEMATDAFRQLIATGSAKDCIRSAIILPLNGSQITGLSNFRVWLGEFDTGKSYVSINSSSERIVKDVLTINIPWQATDWRRNSPYHELYLYIPYVGLNRLPVGDLIGETSIIVESSVDLASGDTVMQVRASSGKIIAHYNASLGVPMPLGASNVTPMQMANTILSAGQGAASAASSYMKLDVGGGVAKSLGTIQGIMNNLEPIPTCIGGNGGGAILGLQNTAYLFSIFHDTNVSPDSVSAIMGTPTREVKSLSGLSGYVQTIGASVSGAMLDAERSEINKLLDGGIYIE